MAEKLRHYPLPEWAEKAAERIAMFSQTNGILDSWDVKQILSEEYDQAMDDFERTLPF